MNKKKFAVIAMAFALCASLFAQKVTVKKDAGGWKLYDGKTAVEVKGIVWSFTPIGENYTYSLFDQDEAFIQRMIDTDMPMLKSMGVNVIRCFTTIPPKWVEYIYTKYGIYTVINDLLGRYGVSVNGTWYPQTDYSDYYTREVLIQQAKDTAEKFKDVKGVLMYMFGNESNYGLVWSSSEIENLPVGEQNVVKAGYLYDLLEKAMAACKEIDPDRPVGIVNGDVQYLDLISKLCPSLDVLGVNAYRGYKFYDSFYENVADTLDKPIVLTESGADAFNDILHQEDQFAQMTYLKTQWQEIYEQSYGKGKSQNMLGGFVFEWMDEWWKRYQVKNLDIHDEASWANAGYELDYKEGSNNMSEEWFGICAQSTITENGINIRIPRAAYYMLSDAWKLSMYDSTAEQIAATFNGMNDAVYLAKGNEKSIKQTINENKKVQITTLSTTVQSTTPVYVNGVLEDIKNKTRNWADVLRYKNADGGINSTHLAAETTLGISVKPFENLSADVSLRAATAEPYTNLHDHNASYFETKNKVHGDNLGKEDQLKYVDVYSASFNYQNKLFDLNGYYHTGHASFEGNGDPFCISSEGFDIIGYDTYGSKAPIALEFVGKGALSGLTVIGGPEIVGGAKPQVQANWVKWIPNVGPLDGIFLNATGAAEFAKSEHVLIDPYAAFGGGYKASVYAETYIMPWFQLKGGFLTAGSEKIGAYYVDNNKELKQINILDTLGGYLHFGTDMFQHTYIYSNVIYRGVVADTNPQFVRGSFYTADSGSGNRFEVQVGTNLAFGNFEFKPVIRARTPLQKPMGRSLTMGAPFIVGLGNRQAVEVEAVLTYDPEGGTWFHEWNSNDIEGAKLAFSLTGLYQLYAGKTDSIPYKGDTDITVTRNDGTKVTDIGWNEGGALGVQHNLWQVGGRVVTNLVPGLRVIGNFDVGHMGASCGAWADAKNPEYVTFVHGGLSARYKHFIAKTDFTVNGWGVEGWYRNFNITFPLQYTIDVAYAFNEKPSFMEATNRVGVKIEGRNFGKGSTDSFFALPMGAGVEGSKYFELTTYVNIGL